MALQSGNNREFEDSWKRRKAQSFDQGLTFLGCSQIFRPWYWKVNTTSQISVLQEMRRLESQNELLSPYISIIYNHQIEKQAQTWQQMKQESDGQISLSNSGPVEEPRGKSPTKIAKYRKTFLARAFYKLQRLNSKASQRTQSQWQQFSSPELNHQGCPLDYFGFEGLDQ